MSVWIRNLKTNLESRPVLILHGNVRDKYIDSEGHVYENLTHLLRELAGQLPLAFTEFLLYDGVANERCVRLGDGPSATPPRSDRVAGEPPPDYAQGRVEHKQLPPGRFLAAWLNRLRSSDGNCFAVIHYLDKLVAYETSQSQEQRDLLLRLEKLIENITPNHRLVLVALKDTMVPVELYTNSPKTFVFSIAMPGKAERLAYLRHRLGAQHAHLELIGDLTEGLFLRDLDHIISAVRADPDLSSRDATRLVNRYRIGEQEDYWGTLRVDRLRDARRWFVEEEGVKGQDEAIGKAVDMLCKARSGLAGTASGRGSKPKGALFFAGPTGVGKTLLARKLAKFLFSTEEAFLRFDMSEFKEEHTVSKLIGSPPGYVGFERGGMLTNAVRERPFSVILFDELEKAHPRIMDIFLQLLEDGRLTDSRGQTVFFTETVVIFTSNLGTRTHDSRGQEIRERETLEALRNNSRLSEEEKRRQVRDHFRRAVERFFALEISRPELLNRIGNNIVPFNFIHSSAVQEEIVRSHLKRIQEEFADRYRSARHGVSFDNRVAPWLAAKHGTMIGEFGGRGVANAIEDEILTPLAYAVLETEEDGAEGIAFQVRVADGGCIEVLSR